MEPWKIILLALVAATLATALFRIRQEEKKMPRRKQLILQRLSEASREVSSREIKEELREKMPGSPDAATNAALRALEEAGHVYVRTRNEWNDGLGRKIARPYYAITVTGRAELMNNLLKTTE